MHFLDEFVCLFVVMTHCGVEFFFAFFVVCETVATAIERVYGAFLVVVSESSGSCWLDPFRASN
jgi:hypothetical protein